MNTVNPATQFVLGIFSRRSDEVPLSEHPYTLALQARPTDAWDDENRAAAIRAMGHWVNMTVGGALATAIGELTTLIERAKHHGETKAANDVEESMAFIDRIFRIFFADIEEEHVAEVLFEHGQKRTADEAAASKAAASPTPPPGKIHRPNWSPSEN